MAYTVESYYVKKGFKCVVIGTKRGYRYGYIGIPEGHPYFKVHYNDIDIPIHGGWTYSGFDKEYPVKNENIWWIGFDCAHYNDRKDIELIKKLGGDSICMFFYELEKEDTNKKVRTEEYVSNELSNAVKILYDI